MLPHDKIVIGKRQVFFKEEMLGETYGQSIFANACFGASKKERFSVVMLEMN